MGRARASSVSFYFACYHVDLLSTLLLWPMRMLCNALLCRESTSLVERCGDPSINALKPVLLLFSGFHPAVQLANFYTGCQLICGQILPSQVLFCAAKHQRATYRHPICNHQWLSLRRVPNLPLESLIRSSKFTANFFFNCKLCPLFF